MVENPPLVEGVDQEPIIKQLFAKNEDGSYVLSINDMLGKVSDPNQRAFVESKLLQARDSGVGTPDANMAIELCKGRFESPDAYTARITKIYDEYQASLMENQNG